MQGAPSGTAAGGGRLPVLVICGPTAVGKTDIAIAVAQRLGGEVISADSMQVYRGMNIGTAKPAPADRGGVPHHLIDVVAPDDPFSAADFQVQARRMVGDIRGRGRLPMVVGGTGFYIRAALHDYVFSPLPVDHALRRRLAAEADAAGPETLHARLAAVDPVAAARIDPRNARRVVRALEVYLQTGEPISVQQHGAERELFDVLEVGLTMPRPQLYARINQRVNDQLSEGLLDEVKGLLGCYPPQLPAMQGLMYRESVAYLRGLVTFDEMVSLMQRNNRRYAKRQYTWFRREPRIAWIDVGESKNGLSVVEEIVMFAAGKWGSSVEVPTEAKPNTKR